MLLLAQVQRHLAEAGIISYLEQSRRGGHAWVFLSEPLSARVVRAWLLPFAPAEVEFFPKQDETSGVGSLIRVPLGVHRLSDRRYPFVTWQDGKAVPYASSLPEMVTYCLTHFQRVPVPTQQERVALLQQSTHIEQRQPPKHTSLTKNVRTEPTSGYRTIADWCAAQDPFP